MAPSRRDLAIVGMDGVLGVMIGTATIGSQAAASPLMPDRLAGFLGGAGFSTVLLGIPMLLATLVLTPVLLWVFRSWAHLKSRAYYLRCAVGGILFGVAASGGVGLFAGLIAPLLPQLDATLAQRLAIAVAAPGLLMIGFALSSFLFLPQLLVTGVGFGLLNGWLVRRVAPPPGASLGDRSGAAGSGSPGDA
jgi:hypothetical protein